MLPFFDFIMKSKLLLYLKSNNYSDVEKVNSLLVAAFVRNNGWSVSCNQLLLSCLLSESDKSMDFVEQIAQNDNVLTIEDLTKLFEYVVSPADRIVTGAVYTPKNVRGNILQRVLGDKSVEELHRIRIADISCGCGGFLMDAAQWIHDKTGKTYANIFRDNIWGIDIQDYSIERTKILLSLLAISEGEDADFEFNLLNKDTLDFECGDWDDRYSGFDIIVGNPPYVCSRNLSDETHEKLKKYDVCSSGHPDLYIPFFKIAVGMLNNEGRLGYITMNTFLRSVNGRAIRNYFSRNRHTISIVDFRGFQVFESKNTYTCLFFLDKQTNSDVINYAVDDQGSLAEDIQYTSIAYSDLDDNKGWTLNKYKSSTAIESIGIQIKDYCPSRHGIATLSNDTFIFKPIAEDKRYYYIDSDGKKYPIEKGICRNIVNPNKLNSVDTFDLLLEKVIFPYRVEGSCASVIEPEEMSHRFPKALAYLKARKEVLLKRDKGNTKAYPQWYAFGRTQSLVMPRFKLFFPKFANRPLRCVIHDDPELLLYNGLAFVSSEERKLRILKAIIESELFWEYIQANGKPYASGYYSLSGVDIKHFGIPKFINEEENELLSIDDKASQEKWLRQHYAIHLNRQIV